MNRLNELFESQDLNQKELSLKLGFSKSAFNNWLRGIRTPDTETVCRLCDYFGCTTDYMLGRSSFRHPAVTEEQATLLQAYEQLPLAIREAVDGLMAPYRVGSSQKSA